MSGSPASVAPPPIGVTARLAPVPVVIAARPTPRSFRTGPVVRWRPRAGCRFRMNPWYHPGWAEDGPTTHPKEGHHVYVSRPRPFSACNPRPHQRPARLSGEARDAHQRCAGSEGRRVISIGPEATVKEALALFVEHNIGSLPVVAVSGQLIGIFTERDVIFGDHRDSERFHRQLVKEVPTSNPITCSPKETLAEAMGKLAKHRVGQLPVVDGSELVGLVSVGDLIEALYEQIEAENQHLMNYLHGRS
jgi:CBS domain-containing protein